MQLGRGETRVEVRGNGLNQRKEVLGRPLDVALRVLRSGGARREVDRFATQGVVHLTHNCLCKRSCDEHHCERSAKRSRIWSR